VVAFLSKARNITGSDTTDTADVFVRDLDTGTTVRASAGLGGAEANGQSFAPSVSGDGRTVVFASDASNLVSGDTNGVSDVFAFDRTSGTIRRVNTTPAGAQADGNTLTSNGRPVANNNASVFAFGTTARNLLGEPPGIDIVARDLAANTTERLTTGGDLDNIYEETESTGPSISADGRRVAFAAAVSLPRYLGGSPIDVFVRDRQTGSLARISQVSQCVPAFDVNGFPAISANGRWVAFQSTSIGLLQPGVYQGGTAPPSHLYVASALPPSGTEICGLSVRPRTIHTGTGGNIRIVLSKRGSFRIRIYRKRGHKLHRRATITGRGLGPGHVAIPFNGRIHGQTLSAGTYVAVANGSARGVPWKRYRFAIRRP
jgi:Tol biopolymer transport system component